MTETRRLLRTFIIAGSLIVMAKEGARAQNPSAPAAPMWPEPPVKLLILGTFHFSDAGLDSYRPKYDVDILTRERQVEVEDVIERLARFRPTKVAVEAMPAAQQRLDSLYRAYVEGRYTLPSNEIYQLGFRLARRLGHTRVYAVDAKRRFYEPWVDPDEYAAAHGQGAMLDSSLWALYQRHHEYDDALKMRHSLREHLLYLNTPEQVRRSHGQYVIGNFEVGTPDEYPGVDAKTAWYSRNLRIFANVQRIADMRGDRIVLIIGAGHLSIIRHAAESSPQFELIEVSEVLGPQ